MTNVMEMAARRDDARAAGSATAAPAAAAVLDCRWLGRGGVGMVTELTLRAFRELALLGELADPLELRGRSERLEQLSWPGTTVRDDSSDPQERLGQRGWERDHRVEMAFHQFRPLSSRRRVQWLHDVIPMHFATSTADRLLRRAYLRRVVATSDHLLVASAHARTCIIDELGADADDISIVTYPVDLALRAEVLRIRAMNERVERIVFIGRFARHKNVDGLLRGFARSEFARQGGQLHLVGGTADEVAALSGRDAANVVVETSVPRERIIELLATSAGLVQPSFEEGFGLPVWEARTVDLPVIASNCGSLPELITRPENLFDPYDDTSIAGAIDRMTSRCFVANEPVPDGPGLLDFGRTVAGALRGVLDR